MPNRRTWVEGNLINVDFGSYGVSPIECLPVNQRIESTKLVRPIQQAFNLLERDKYSKQYELPPAIVDSEVPDSHYDQDGRIVINAPIGWIQEVAGYIGSQTGQTTAEQFQILALTTITTKKYMEHEVTGQFDLAKFYNSPAYGFADNQQSPEVSSMSYADELSLALWQTASAVALRATIDKFGNRERLIAAMEFVALSEAAELFGIDPPNKETKKITPTPLKVYKLGCTIPATTQQLVAASPRLLKAANL